MLGQVLQPTAAGEVQRVHDGLDAHCLSVSSYCLIRECRWEFAAAPAVIRPGPPGRAAAADQSGAGWTGGTRIALPRPQRPADDACRAAAEVIEDPAVPAGEHLDQRHDHDLLVGAASGCLSPGVRLAVPGLTRRSASVRVPAKRGANRRLPCGRDPADHHWPAIPHVEHGLGRGRDLDRERAERAGPLSLPFSLNRSEPVLQRIVQNCSNKAVRAWPFLPSRSAVFPGRRS
jgi:hypothetical protein